MVKQGATYNVMIGNGQPLVVGTRTYDLSMAQSPTDPNRPMVAYKTINGTVLLSDESLSGGKLGGMLEFRSKPRTRRRTRWAGLRYAGLVLQCAACAGAGCQRQSRR